MSLSVFQSRVAKTHLGALDAILERMFETNFAKLTMHDYLGEIH